MKLRYLSLGAIAVSLGTFVVAAGCATGDDSDRPSLPDGGEPDVHVEFPDAITPEGGKCGARCSSDFHNVLDCNGKVVATCADHQGCDPTSGACVDACDSAKANKGSIGCDFYGVAPAASDPTKTNRCYAIFVANTWSSAVTVSADYAGAPLDVAAIARIPSGNGANLTYAPLPGGKIPPGQVAILFVAGPGCPDGINGNAPSSVSATGLGSAVHIATDRPVAAYDIYPYGGGTSAVTSASLLLPTSAWDTNYVAVSPFEVSTVSSIVKAPAGIHIVAAENGTQVTVLAKKGITGGPGVAPAPANVPTTYSLSKGQQLVFMQTQLLDGSPIQSNKPVGMWSTMSCMNIPTNKGYCDSAHQQVPPVQALGSEYALVRYRNRRNGAPEETPPWRFVGLVDGTQLAWEPSTPPGAPTSLSAGQVAVFDGSGPYSVRSQDDKHPFYVSAHMTGCSTIGAVNTAPDGCMGDAEYVNVVPAQEFQNSYVFFTDPTYPESNVVFVRSKASDGQFRDVVLDCVGTITGWQPVGTSGKYEYARFDLVRGNFEKQGNCDNGRHVAKSDAPFGMTVWGWGSLATGSEFYSQAVSYAYPGGMSVKPINTVIIPPNPN